MTKPSEWGLMEIVGSVIYGITAILGIILLAMGLSLNQTSDLNNPNNDALTEAMELFVEIARRCLLGAGIVLIIVVIPAIIGLFIPSINVMKGLSMVTAVLMCPAACVVIVLAIIPTIFISAALPYCAPCSEVTGDCLDESGSNFCVHTKPVAVAGTYLLYVGLFFMLVSLVMAFVTLSKHRKMTKTTTVVVTAEQPPVAVGYQPPTQPQQGYPPQGNPQDYTQPPPNYAQ